MAIKDLSKKPFIEDRKENVFIGIDLPFRKSNGIEGWFASTTTTIESVKNNIRNLLNTHKGERYMQPTLGLNLRNYMFEQITIDLQDTIKTEILETFNFWLPFVQIQNLDIDILESSTSDKNKLTISVLFNIVRDPNTTESVQVEIGD
tara:strand:- start:320 stop:763 length:444 start_codon:yes stop_codon:yes gene_type:complete